MQTRSQQAISRCKNCGQSKFKKNQTGDIVCAKCGVTFKQKIQQVSEEFGRSSKRGIHMIKQKKSHHHTKKLTHLDQDRESWGYSLEAMQLFMQKTIKKIALEFNFDHKFEQNAKELWFSYLKQWQSSKERLIASFTMPSKGHQENYGYEKEILSSLDQQSTLENSIFDETDIHSQSKFHTKEEDMRLSQSQQLSQQQNEPSQQFNLSQIMQNNSQQGQSQIQDSFEQEEEEQKKQDQDIDLAAMIMDSENQGEDNIDDQLNKKKRKKRRRREEILEEKQFLLEKRVTRNKIKLEKQLKKEKKQIQEKYYEENKDNFRVSTFFRQIMEQPQEILDKKFKDFKHIYIQLLYKEFSLKINKKLKLLKKSQQSVSEISQEFLSHSIKTRKLEGFQKSLENKILENKQGIMEIIWVFDFVVYISKTFFSPLLQEDVQEWDDIEEIYSVLDIMRESMLEIPQGVNIGNDKLKNMSALFLNNFKKNTQILVQNQPIFQQQQEKELNFSNLISLQNNVNNFFMGNMKMQGKIVPMEFNIITSILMLALQSMARPIFPNDMLNMISSRLVDYQINISEFLNHKRKYNLLQSYQIPSIGQIRKLQEKLLIQVQNKRQNKNIIKEKDEIRDKVRMNRYCKRILLDLDLPLEWTEFIQAVHSMFYGTKLYESQNNENENGNGKNDNQKKGNFMENYLNLDVNLISCLIVWVKLIYGLDDRFNAIFFTQEFQTSLQNYHKIEKNDDNFNDFFGTLRKLIEQKQVNLSLTQFLRKQNPYEIQFSKIVKRVKQNKDKNYIFLKSQQNSQRFYSRDFYCFENINKLKIDLFFKFFQQSKPKNKKEPEMKSLEYHLKKLVDMNDYFKEPKEELGEKQNCVIRINSKKEQKKKQKTRKVDIFLDQDSDRHPNQEILRLNEDVIEQYEYVSNKDKKQIVPPCYTYPLVQQKGKNMSEKFSNEFICFVDKCLLYLNEDSDKVMTNVRNLEQNIVNFTNLQKKMKKKK